MKKTLPASVGLLVVISSTSFAQTAQQQGGTGALEEIIVTAQRRSERLQDVPIAVTAASAAQLAASGVQSSQDLGLITPGLTIPQTSGSTQPHIRGVGTISNGPGIENPVATYIDGVYVASAPGSLLTLNDIEQVEVLKGPQGTLFGRNSTGGLIQITTKDPEKTLSGALNLGYGNYKTSSADGYITGGLTDDITANLALRYEHQDEGFGHNLFDGSEVGKLNHDFAARAKFVFAPAEGTKIRLALDYEDRNSTRDVQVVDSTFPATFNNPFFGGPFPQGGFHDINYNTSFVNTLKAGGASLQVNQDIGGLTLQSITAYRKSNFKFDIDIDLVPANLFAAFSTAVDSQVSQEFQLSPKESGQLKWVAGLFYFHDNAGWKPITIDLGAPVSPVPGVPVSIIDDNKINTNSVAVYAQGSYEILPDTNLTLGGRYTNEKKSVGGTETLQIGGVTAAVTPFPIIGLGIETKLEFNRFNYRVAIDHKITSNVLAYVSYNTGFKSGGYNLTSSTNPPYLPESIKAVEVGLKTELFDKRARLNVSGFHYDYSNIQVSRYIASSSTITNGAKAKLYGFDLDGEWAATGSLTLSAGFSYIHSEFTEFPNADFYVPVNGCVPAPGGICPGNAAGKELPYAPKTTANLGGNYEVETSIGKFAANVNYFHSAEFFAAPANTGRQGAYHLVNVSLSWKDSSDRYSVRIWGKNITDTEYNSSFLESAPGIDAVRGYPRTYGVTAGIKF